MELVQGDELSEEGAVNECPLLERLAVSKSHAGNFRGWPPRGFTGRLFGGHLLAQVIMAAADTVMDNRTVNSLHVYFLAAGRQDTEIDYCVERVRDGRSFAVRHVRAVQGGRLLVQASLSFVTERSDEETLSVAMPAVPLPEGLTPLHERVRDPSARPTGFKWPARRDWWTASRPLDIRCIDDSDLPDDTSRYFWFRTAPAIGAPQNHQRAILAFASDRSLLPAVTKARQGSLERPGGRVASVDHALWFHADVFAGEWYLYAQDSPFSTAGLGLARGLIFAQDGRLAATVTQQGVFSPPEGTGDRRNPRQ
ncbi:acyl-CoA thioesterase [Pseudarthrobacter sp. alpha12b]